MSLAPATAKLLALSSTVTGLGAWFLWRLRPSANVTDPGGAEEARWKLIHGFTWCIGAVTGFVTVLVLHSFGDWTSSVALTMLFPLVRGGWLLWRGVLEGFAATNPRRS